MLDMENIHKQPKSYGQVAFLFLFLLISLGGGLGGGGALSKVVLLPTDESILPKWSFIF
jgi:hypothetical protein